MTSAFDPGYAAEPYQTLCSQYPDGATYPPDQFRLEWGPIFHRGRLDGSARVIVIGQDPAQHESIVRRILVGEAGRRVQGLLGKLGITRSYVMVNTFLYSVYGSVKAKTRRDPVLIEYRNRWLGALFAGGQVEAVISLGKVADEAWQIWRTTPEAQGMNVAYTNVAHPTQPESSSKGDKAKLAVATQKLLQNWNLALQAIAPDLLHPDVASPMTLYGAHWQDGDRTPIPAFDMPAGLPAWMHEQDGWATRKGPDDLAKRRNITLTVPKEVVA